MNQNDNDHWCDTVMWLYGMFIVLFILTIVLGQFMIDWTSLPEERVEKIKKQLDNLDKIFTKKYNKHIKVGDKVRFTQHIQHHGDYEHTGTVYALHPYGFGNFLVVEVNVVVDYILIGVDSSQVELVESHNE